VTPPTPLDQQSLDQLRMLERERPGLMKELIRLFVADAPKQMRLIDSAYAKRDPEGVRQAAHFLRSGALALGLSWLAEKSNVLEHLELEQYGSEQSNQWVAQLRAELHKVLLALLKELKGG
jgi:HPt (histidine-containing phosphotransfer) domain-containing protein